jgi:flagellar biosynthesis protein FliR
MDLTVSLSAVEVVMLAGVRIAAFLVVAPPFASKAVPGQVKAMLSMGIAMAVAPRAAQASLDAGVQTGQAIASGSAVFFVDLLGEVLVGAGLGFGVSMVFAAVQSAGGVIDLFGGFQMASAFDPASMTRGAQFTKMYQATTVALLFASSGYQLVLGGLVRTFDVIPLGAGLDLAVLGQSLTTGFSQLMVAALQIAGPLIAVLFLADIGLGLLTRVAPALNAFALGFPLKILLTLVLGVTAYLALPQVVDVLTEDAVTQMLGVAS